MLKRPLGRQGLVTSALGYGAMRIAFDDATKQEPKSIAAIRQAFDDGVRHFDTAELYGWGRSEKMIGTALASVRDEVTIATKFGFMPGFIPNSQPDHVREVVDNSLRHLGVDHIDVLYQHVDDPAVPVEEVIGVMKEAVNAGKVRYLGLSNTSKDNIRRAHAAHPISVVQDEYSIFQRRAENLFDLLEELGIGLVAFAPLARGFLTGAVKATDRLSVDDVRRNYPWWAPGNLKANVAIVEQLADLAKTRNATVSQLSLAWILARKPYIVPIPGSGAAARVSENDAAADLVLTADDIAHIDRIAAYGGQSSHT